MAKKKNEVINEIETQSDNILLDSKQDNEELQNELKDYIDERVNCVFLEELEKTNKKLIREKSKRIFWKNIIIVLLLLLVGFLTYLLYTSHYFDKFFNNNSNVIEKEEKKEDTENKDEKKEEEVKTTPSPSPTPKPPTLDELKKEYSSLLDNYYVTENSSYLSSFYEGNLTSDMMKYMTLNTFNFATFEKEEDYNIIKESTFKMMYEKLFDSDYTAGTFNYDDNKVRYVKAMEAYMSTEFLVRKDNNIKREIKDIKLDDGKVVITTVEGVIKENKLYNVLSNEEIPDYQDDSLIKYEDKLNKLVYTFKDGKLLELSK